MDTLTPDRALITPGRDRAARGMIVGAGALCFLLLAWGHLGLGALFLPPPRAIPRQVTGAGALRVTLTLESGQMTAAGPNTVSVTLTDGSGRAISGAVVAVHPVMRGMAMDAPAVVAAPVGNGHYIAHPRFAMAGDWQLVVTITRPGQPPQTASFEVTARWT